LEPALVVIGASGPINGELDLRSSQVVEKRDRSSEFIGDSDGSFRDDSLPKRLEVRRFPTEECPDVFDIWVWYLAREGTSVPAKDIKQNSAVSR